MAFFYHIAITGVFNLSFLYELVAFRLLISQKKTALRQSLKSMKKIYELQLGL